MNREEVARGRAKSLLESFSRGRAVQLDMLHNMLIVCLGAYVIAGSRGYPSGEAHGPFTYDYWLQVAGSQNTLYARDLVYDLIFPAAPKGLRVAVRELDQNERLTAEVGPLVAELFSQRPGREELRELAEQLITGFYPLVIPAPIDTPLPVNRLCMEILAPKNGAFYDGTSGLGSTCMEAGRYAAGHGGGLNIFAQEKLDVLCAVSTVRAYLNGLEDFTVRGGDVLTAPAYTVGNTVASFDYSVMFPPLGLPWGEAERELAWDKYRRFSGGPVPRSNAEWLFVQHQLASLKEKGRGIIAVSTGSLFNDSARWIRRRLLETNCIDCVITLPSHILPYTATPLSLLVLDRGRDPDRTDVLMVQTEGMFRNVSAARVASQLDEELIQEITALLKEKTDTPYSRAVSMGEIEENDSVLLPSRYVVNPWVETELGMLNVDFARMRGWPSLGDMAEKIYRGVNGSRLSSGAGDSYRIINYADVQDGVLCTEGLKECWADGQVGRYLVRPGDVLVSCKGAQIKTCLVPEGTENVLLSLNFIGIRLKQSVYSPEFLLCYLNSPAGLAYLKSRQIGTSIITLKNSDLERMPVPQVSLEVQRECISEFDSVRLGIEEELRRLYHCLNLEKGRLYQKMGLDGVWKRKDD